MEISVCVFRGIQGWDINFPLQQHVRNPRNLQAQSAKMLKSTPDFLIRTLWAWEEPETCVA